MPLQIYEWTSPSTPHKLTQLQYNRVQHSYSTIEYNTVINATPYSVTYSTIEYNTVHHSAETVQEDPLLLLYLLFTYHREIINISNWD